VLFAFCREMTIGRTMVGFLKYNMIRISAICLAVMFCVSACGRREVGLFEYVRKGQKFIEEGKYQKGLMLLHKAYEEAPDSKDIAENLFYGYLKYAEVLESDGELDKAIDYLSMAYEMEPSNMVVSNNLAVLICKKAVNETENGDYTRAMELLKQAVGMVLEFKKPRENVSAFLFNSSVEAYNRRDQKAAFMFLTASHLLVNRFETHYMLGQYFYDIGKLDKAEFYWEKALKMKPGNTEVKDKLDKVYKERNIKSEMIGMDTAHFKIQFYRDYDIDAAKLDEIFVRIYNGVGDDLDYFPATDTGAIFYSEDDFRKIFNQSGIVRAFYDGKIRMFLSSGIDDPNFPGLMAHEYTHAVLSMMTNNHCPVWLHEGIATYEQSKYMPVNSGFVRAFLASGERVELAKLETGFSSKEVRILGLSYEGSYFAVSFVINKWGWSGLRGLLERIKDGEHYANAIDEEFLISTESFEAMMNYYIKKKLK